VFASIDVLSDGRARFRARFAPGTFSRTGTLVQFLLDTDRNASTGVPYDPYGFPNMGLEYYVVVGSDYEGGAGVLKKYDQNARATFVSSELAIFGSDEIEVTLPTGGIDGRMTFRVITQSQLSVDGFTGTQDAAPNDDRPPASVQ